MIHWDYDGEREFYTEDGKLDSVKVYDNGELKNARAVNRS